jgi:hypothetical protein
LERRCGIFLFFGLNRFETLGIGLNLAEQFRPDVFPGLGLANAFLTLSIKKMFQNGLINLD